MGIAKKLALAVGIISILLIIGLVYYLTSFDGKIYRGVSAVGIDLSGLSKEQGEIRLSQWIAAHEGEPLLLQYAEFEQQRTIGELGLKPDTTAVIEEAFLVGRSGMTLKSLMDIGGAAIKGHEIKTRSFIRMDVLKQKVSELATTINREPLDGDLKLAGGIVVKQPPQPGRSLDQNVAIEQLLTMLDRGEFSLFQLPVIENIRPDIDEPQLDQAATKAEELLQEPLILTFDTQRWEYASPELAKLFLTEKSWSNEQPILSIIPNEREISAMIGRIASQVNQPMVEAQWSFNGSAVEVTRSSQTGLSVDTPATVEALTGALMNNSAREIPLVVQQTTPKLSTETINNWGINGLVATVQTNYYSGKERMHNIETAARKLNGFLIPQGETFSLNKALGPVNTETGYDQAYIILNGETVPGMGGGLCQVATTFFQAVFWTGYTVVERYPHDYHMPRYESTKSGVTYKGLDAAFDSGLDFSFINNGPGALYVQVGADGEQFTVSLFGTPPDWKVGISAYTLKNLRPSGHQHIVKQNAAIPPGQEVQVEKATDGFDSSITRIVTKTDGSSETYTVNSSYRATEDIFLVGTGPAKTEPSPSTGSTQR